MSFHFPDRCTIWNEAGNDGTGHRTWSAPEVIKCRYTLRNEKRTDANGDDFVSKAAVYSTSENVRIGTMIQIGVSGSPSPTAMANDIRALSQTPSAAGEMRKAWL